MTFLAPALLALGLAAAVPLALHLLQRHPGPRVVFPALRYLRRAEREHARRIRLRQILLLALRVLALLLLAAAAARPFLRGVGGGHPPTSVVLVLDNSLSTGAVAGDRRVLDELRQAALATLEAAGPGDRFWLIRAGAPGEAAVEGDAAALADAVGGTEPEPAAGDLAEALRRARAILALEPAERAREVHLLSDLQATAFVAAEGSAGADDAAPPVVVYAPDRPAPANRAVTAVEVGGGLPPRAGERSTVAVEVAAPAGDSVAVRLVLEGSVRAAGHAAPDRTTILPFPARAAGRVTGYVELDPDALRADDRRYFVAEVRPPTPLAVAAGQPFLEEAVTVLEEAGRVRRVAPAVAAVVLAPAARWVEQVRRGAAVLVLPPAAPVEVAAANQRLASAGIPWRFGAPVAGEARLDTTTSAVAATLGEVRLGQVYGLSGPAEDSVVLRLRSGDPWAVRGRLADGGRFLILASPMTADGGTLPVSAAMIPFLDHAISVWAAGATAEEPVAPGDVVSAAGDAVAGPSGTDSIGTGGSYRPMELGIHHVLSAGDTVGAFAVNPPAAESHLERIAPEDVAARLPATPVATAAPGGWAEVIFRQRTGRELTPWLLAGVLLLLAVEMAAAATGRMRRGEGE